MSINAVLPVRVAAVWALAIMFTAILSGIWLIFQPTLTFVAVTFNAAIYDMEINCTSSDNLVSLLKLGIDITIPVLIGGLWIWAIISSQKKDPRGYYA